MYFTVIWRIKDTDTFKKRLNRFNPDFRKKLFDRLDGKECREFRFFLHSVEQPLREFGKPKIKIGDRVRIWKYNLTFRKVYKPQYTKEKFKIAAISPKKPRTYTIKDTLNDFIRGKFYQKELINVIQQENRLQKGAFLIGLHNYFQTKHSALLKSFYQSNWIWKVNGTLQFWQETFKHVRIPQSGTWSLPFHYGYC